MIILFAQNESVAFKEIQGPQKGFKTDSGWDLRAPEKITLKKGERQTVNLKVKFQIEVSSWKMKILNFFGIGIEGQIRPKSGRSKNGLDVEIGTVDEPYTGWVGCTITNTTNKTVVIEENEKLCQIVFVPVFNRINVIRGKVEENKTRGSGGFGSTKLK